MVKPRINFLKLSSVFLIFIVGFFIFLNWRILSARQKVAIKLKETQQSLQELIAEKEIIQDTILQGQSNDYLEQVGREELNFKKPGEQAVAFPNEVANKETDTGKKIKDLWQKFMEMSKRDN